MTDRKYVNTTTEIDRIGVAGEIFFVKELHEYGYDDKPLNKYTGYSLAGMDSSAIVQLSQLAEIMKDLPEGGLFDMDYDETLEWFKEWAAETAEEAELPFTFTDRDGDTNTYNPAALWEESGSCSWETSAQEGYDYGWNI